MRRRQIWEERARQLAVEEDQKRKEAQEQMSIKVPNSNIISKSAQPDLKEKANMFLPHEKDIVKPNASPYRKRGSKPGPGCPNPTEKKNKY